MGKRTRRVLREQSKKKLPNESTLEFRHRLAQERLAKKKRAERK